MQGDPSSCGFYKWESEYKGYLRRHNMQQASQRVDGGERYAKRSPDRIYDGTHAELENLRRELYDLKHQLEQMQRRLDLRRVRLVCFIAFVLAMLLKPALGVIMIIFVKNYLV